MKILAAFAFSLAAQAAAAAPVIGQVNYIDSMPIGNVFAFWHVVVVDSDTQAPLEGVHYSYSIDTSCLSIGGAATAEGYTDADGVALMGAFVAVAPNLACATELDVDGVAPLSLPVHTFWPQDVVITPDAAAISTLVNAPFNVTVRTTESGLPVNAFRGQFTATSSSSGSSAATQCCVQFVYNTGVYTMPFLANDKQGHYTIVVEFGTAPPATVDVTQRVKR